ncbi:MAG: aminotransferase class I/II-fold pyridoxal phosphate-dependent enzyme [Bacteroidales bacterium]|nr:aminotransferase class I/II-fold pyridoxal phosphate-dependent enzyme [Bacteroidales bacterium]
MIHFLDIRKITESYEPALSEAANRVIKRGWYLLGDEVKAFEQEYAAYIGAKHCIGVANGLDALRLILKAYIEMGVMAEGDEVIVPANTYIASVLAITDNKLKPVLAEPDIDTYNIDISNIERLITEKTKAIMVVHLYGRACWPEKLEALAAKYGLKIIEDNAQASGAIIETNNLPGKVEKRTGALGHASGHSFYPGKNLGALGDAGAVTTSDDELAAIIRAIANYGSSKKYINDYQGLNSRLDEIQAAVLRVKLQKLDADNQHRRNIARYFIDNITCKGVVLPKTAKGKADDDLSHVWHLFVLRHPQRDELQKFLADNQVQTLIHYPVPPHKQKAYSDLQNLSLPVTEKIHREVLSLPISQVITSNEAEKIVETLNRF